MEQLSKLLKALFNNNVHLAFNEETQSVKLEEPENTDLEELRSVRVYGIERFYFSFKMDKTGFPFLGRMMKDGYARKSGDSVIFCEQKGQKYVLM
ncbi:MAG: hypothetical protein HC880_11835 [Bacteroidia bacterium]|nr:hypothetical protein [Bacteroidia bacterium]